MSEFKNYYCLKARNTLDVDVLNNPDDAKFFFGNIISEEADEKPLNEYILELINKSVIQFKVPKIYLWGQYGSGKTHMLHHIKYRLHQEYDEKFLIKLFKLEIKKNTNFQYLHKKIMNSIGIEEVKRLFLNFLTSCGDDQDKIQEFFTDDSFQIVARILSLSPPSSPQRLLAWRWLCGEKMSTTDLTSLTVPNSIDENEMLVMILRKIGLLFKEEKKTLLILIDEGEKLRNINDINAQNSFADAFRELADKENVSIGFILSIYASTQSDIPTFIFGEEILTRLKMTNVKEVPYLERVNDVQGFIKDLLNEFIDKEKAKKDIKENTLGIDLDYYPFDDNAIEKISEYATNDPTKSTPRRIIDCLQECAIESYTENKKPIDESIVDSVAPTIFR